jgi:hypothetical protein
MPASATYVRPKAAGSISVSLVPAFPECTAPNHEHGPPLEFPSCYPAVEPNASVIFGYPEGTGTPANLVGRIKLVSDPGTPGPPDDSDLLMQGSVSDVRCRADVETCVNYVGSTSFNADYTGFLRATFTARITDRFNGPDAGGGTDPATSTDLALSFTMTCDATPSTTTGSDCGANTSINSIVPGWITDGKRTVFEVGQFGVLDGGTDGSPSTPPNATVLRQGVYSP